MKNILVFPCGSEIGLEIYRSARYSTHFNLIGASSIDDHGLYVYENYIGNIPFYDDPGFIDRLMSIIQEYSIDAIYPSMDSVAVVIKENEYKLGCLVIGSSLSATKICASKIETYKILDKFVPLPKWEVISEKVNTFPIFIKPVKGYGARNTFLAKSKEEMDSFINIQKKTKPFIYCEVLPGNEYTIDCFSNRNGELLFSGIRKRNRISNGISVNTYEDRKHKEEVLRFVEEINKIIKPQGAWFFQVKEDKSGNIKLLEVAVRLGGSSSLFRNKGINFALLTLFDAFEYDVVIELNSYPIKLDRALATNYRIDIEYSTIYVDFDDCLLIKDKINFELIAFLYSAMNKGKKIVLLTRHDDSIYTLLEEFRVAQIFDEVIQVSDGLTKSIYIKDKQSIFIDDSFSERKEIKEKLGISVFSPDMIGSLLGN